MAELCRAWGGNPLQQRDLGRQRLAEDLPPRALRSDRQSEGVRWCLSVCLRAGLVTWDFCSQSRMGRNACPIGRLPALSHKQ